MAAGTKIEWAHATWNVVVGCDKVSQGCANCYATTMARRLELMGSEKYAGLTVLQGSQVQWTGKVAFDDAALLKPLTWKKPRRIFVTSMGDPNHPAVTDEMRDRMMAVIALTPQHDYLWLTKRPEEAAFYLRDFDRAAQIGAAAGCMLDGEWIWNEGKTFRPAIEAVIDRSLGVMEVETEDGLGDHVPSGDEMLPLPNMWVGASVESADQKYRIDELREVPAAVRFLSCEPLLGDLGEVDLTGIHWVIAGGESGHKARPMHPDWVRSLRDQCKVAGVPFFFKQWGEWGCSQSVRSDDCDHFEAMDRDGGRWALSIRDCKVSAMSPESQLWKCDQNLLPREDLVRLRWADKKAAGHLLDGVEHFAFPKVVR